MIIDDILWLLNVFLLHLGWRREVEGGKSTDWKIVLHKVTFTERRVIVKAFGRLKKEERERETHIATNILVHERAFNRISLRGWV